MPARLPLRRILVVDDEWLIATSLSALIEEFGHAVVGPAADITTALRLISEKAPHAAVLDVTLGADKSFPIAKVLDAQRIPFLFLTGYTNIDLPPEFNRRIVLHKPVADGALREALTTLLDGPTAATKAREP